MRQRLFENRRLRPLGFFKKLEQTLQRLRFAGCQQKGFEQAGQLTRFVKVHAYSARARTWIGPKASFCTSSTRDSLINSSTAIKVTTTPSLPSSALNRLTKGTNAPPLRRSSTSLMRSRVDSASRVT